MNSNAARNQYRHPNVTDACAAHWTRRTPICELRSRAILYHAQPSGPKAACLTVNHHRRCDRKSVSTRAEK
jgi:hypothetical protein